MKQIGEILKDKRVENGISLDEASEDLNMDSGVLENMEAGNVRAFKDMYILKELIKDYAKYLGCDVNYLMEEFNDFLFEYTSKISLEEIEKMAPKIEEKKVFSPYTKIPKQKKNYKKIVVPIVTLLLFILLISLLFSILNKKRPIDKELKPYNVEEYYELT